MIERCGTKSPRRRATIEPSASTAYTKVATNVPSVTWVPRSRTKLRSMRGPNWVDARVSATIVIENTRPTTVMTAAAIADEDLAGRVGRPVVDPVRQRQVAVIGAPVECVCEREEHDRRKHLEGRDDPQRRPQRLSPPRGKKVTSPRHTSDLELPGGSARRGRWTDEGGPKVFTGVLRAASTKMPTRLPGSPDQIVLARLQNRAESLRELGEERGACGASDGVRSGLAGADPGDGVDGQDPDLAVTDLAGAGGVDDAAMIRSASSSSARISTRTFGTKSIVYSAPRYTSVWPRWRPNPCTSDTVRPCTPRSLSAALTSSSLKGLMMPTMSFMELSPFASNSIQCVPGLRVLRQVEAGLLVLGAHADTPRIRRRSTIMMRRVTANDHAIVTTTARSCSPAGRGCRSRSARHHRAAGDCRVERRVGEDADQQRADDPADEVDTNDVE